jgi:hypothetical protein
LRLQLREQQAAAGDIVLLYGDESEALTHPASSPCDAATRKDRPQPAMPLWQRQEIQEVLFAIAVHSAGPQGASIGDGEIDQSSKGLGRSLRRVIM